MLLRKGVIYLFYAIVYSKFNICWMKWGKRSPNRTAHLFMMSLKDANDVME